MKKILIAILLVQAIQVFAQDKTKGIKIENAMIKNIPPASSTTAGYMLIKNETNKDINLLKAESDISKVVELHTVNMENGVMKMRQVKSILIKANSSIELKPGSFHIMFIGLKSPLKKDEKKKIRLVFDNGQKENLEMQVQDIEISKEGKNEHTHH
jgi:copper(I)-binding protein